MMLITPEEHYFLAETKICRKWMKFYTMNHRRKRSCSKQKAFASFKHCCSFQRRFQAIFIITHPALASDVREQSDDH